MGQQSQQLQPFAYGTVKRPVPISIGGKLSYAAGQSVQLAPIPKSGFLARLRYEFRGQVDVTTADPTPYRVPFEQLIASYKLSNSLGYEYRNMSGDSLYFANQITRSVQGDRVASSPTYLGVNATATATAQPFAFVLTDEIAFNDGINFDKFLLSAQTLDNDLSITMTYAADTSPLYLGVGSGAARFANLAMTVTVTAEFYTVPATSVYALPDTTLVQQIIDDSTYSSLVMGDNFVNLLPIQGPEFLGIGLKVVNGGVADAVDANSAIARVRVIANGTDPIMDWTGQDLIQAFYERFGTKAPAGWVYLDFSDDISLPNAMGPVERNVFSTQAYSQLTLQVTYGAAVASTGGIKLLKRMQSEVAA